MAHNHVLHRFCRRELTLTQITRSGVTGLDDAAAIVSGQFTRYRKDGSVLSKIASTYVFAKSDGQWKITTLIGHGPDRAITCKE